MKIRVVGFSVLGAASLVAGGLALFAFDFPRLATNDMAPTLRTRDLVLACRVCGPPERGDVVFFAPPDAAGQLVARRVVGVPGDKVSVTNGRVLINDRPLYGDKPATVQLEGIDAVDDAPRTFDVSWETNGKHRYQVLRDARSPLSGDRPTEILKDEFFLLADRRTFARDSRDYGPLSRRDIRSTVLRVLSAGDKNGERQTSLP